MTAPLNKPDKPPLKLAGTVLLLILALILTFVILQFRGKLTPEVGLTMVSARSGLVMDRKVNVYSGAGIVAGSDPAAEWQEIENKIVDFVTVTSGRVR